MSAVSIPRQEANAGRQWGGQVAQLTDLRKQQQWSPFAQRMATCIFVVAGIVYHTHTRPCLTCAAYDGGAAKGTNCFSALEARVGAHGPLLSRLRAFTNLARGFVWDGDDERITYPPRMITAQHTSRLHEMQPSQLVSRSPIGVFSVRIV